MRWFTPGLRAHALVNNVVIARFCIVRTLHRGEILECVTCRSLNLPENRFCVQCGQSLAIPLKTDVAESPGREADTSQDPDESTRPLRLDDSNASLWQRAVMLLGAIVLLILTPFIVVGGTPSDVDYTVGQGAFVAAAAIIGLGLGVAAVRPPQGGLRRVLVGMAAVVILLPTAVAFFLLLIFTYVRFVVDR